MKVRTKKSKSFVERVFKNIPRYIDGSLNDTHKIGGVFWTTLTRCMFNKLHYSYKVRSEGGSDDLGNTFEPLKRSTVAQRPIGRNNLKGLGLTKSQSGTAFKDRKRGLLTPEQDKEWRKKYGRTLSQLVRKMSLTKAKKIAAATAWNYVKEELGAQTKLERLGDRDVLIMRVTDRIFNSLEPTQGSETSYRPRRDQIAERVGNKLEIGTAVEYAKFHDQTRPVIPDGIERWVDQCFDYAIQTVHEYIVDEVLQR